MAFEPRGEEVWASVRDRNRVNVYNCDSYKLVNTIKARKPSGIFLTSRAHKTGL